MQHMNKVKSPTTRRQYTGILRGLDKKAAKMQVDGLMTTWPETPVRLVIAYLHVEASLADATARMYRAALDWMLEGDRSDDAFDARVLLYPEPGPDTMERDDQLKAIRHENAKRFPRGAQKKAKSLSIDDRSTLLEALLNNKKSIYARPAAVWFSAAMLTGLRPIEWQFANLTSANRLIIQNAKTSNGRGFAPTRTQELKALSETELTIIRDHLDNVQAGIQRSGNFKLFYNGCRDIIRRTADSLWPSRLRHPTLYTGRHIFAADAKSVFSKEIVAALMGHGSTDTAARSYAHSRTGSGCMMVEPSTADVLAVRARQAGKHMLYPEDQLF